MTPRPVDHDSVAAKLTVMDRALAVLERVGTVTAEQLREDDILRGAIERYLMLLVDQAVAVNLHLASARGGEVVRDYTASFAAAAEAGAITGELADALAGSAGMRNELVHEYVEVDLGLVAAALPSAVSGYRDYVSAIARFLQDDG